MPKYSIVMPVFGVGAFLDNAVQSVLNQVKQDYELILVDDESPDECLKICDRYALTYPQIKVVHQKNTGIAGARNKGFELVSGQYVYFLDSDDTIQPVLLEYFDKVLVEVPDAESIFADFQCVGVTEHFKTANYDKGFIVYTDIVKVQEDFLKRKLQILAPGSLYKVDWYRQTNRKFLNNPFGEDQLVIFYSLLCVKIMVYIRKPLYDYLTRPGSIMTGLSCKKILKTYPFFIELSQVYNTSDKASPIVKQYLLPRWCAGVCHSAAKNYSYEDFKIFLKEVDADKYIPNLIGFPSLIIIILSLVFMFSKRLYYVVNGCRIFGLGGVNSTELVSLHSTSNISLWEVAA